MPWTGKICLVWDHSKKLGAEERKKSIFSTSMQAEWKKAQRMYGCVLVE